MEETNHMLKEPNQDKLYEKIALEQLKNALKRSYEERFLIMTSLMKMNIMFKNAKITHKHFEPSLKSK